jgi:mono/diheme cytochrome c family protein
LLKLGVSTVGAGQFSALTRVALIVVLSSAALVAVVYLLAWRSPVDFSFANATVVVGLALVATWSGEYSREMLRKPYVIGRHMYANGVRLSAVAKLNRDGYLAHSRWVAEKGDPTLAHGEAMFRGQCLACHTRNGYRSMKRLLAGRNPEAIGSLLRVLHEHKPDSPYRAFMPPLVGTGEEIAALGHYLATMTVTNMPTAGKRRD